jgi:hypothetical protein
MDLATPPRAVGPAPRLRAPGRSPGSRDPETVLSCERCRDTSADRVRCAHAVPQTSPISQAHASGRGRVNAPMILAAICAAAMTLGAIGGVGWLVVMALAWLPS